MSKRKYGSKAAYEAARADIRAENEAYLRRINMTQEERDAEEKERTRKRNRERIVGDDAFSTCSIFLAAAMAGGLGAGVAKKEADKAMDILLAKFG